MACHVFDCLNVMFVLISQCLLEFISKSFFVFDNFFALLDLHLNVLSVVIIHLPHVAQNNLLSPQVPASSSQSQHSFCEK